MTVSGDGATAAVGYGAARLRTRRRPRFSRPDTSLSLVGFDSSRKKRWDGRHGFVITGESQFQGCDAHWGFYGASGLAGALSCCRQDRKAARVPPGRHWRVAAGSHWTAPGRPLGQMCTSPGPLQCRESVGRHPPARQDPQASTAANPLDGVQATARTLSFTGGSRLLQRLGLLDWLAG